MPPRNTVPTLKQLAIRVIAWPEALRKLTQMRIPGGRFGVHRLTEHQLHTTNNLADLLRRRSYGDSKVGGIPSFQAAAAVEAIVNAWIRLSDYYQTRLDEIKNLSYLLGANTIKKLDFLHRGYCMRDGTSIAPFAGSIPSAVVPQKVNPYTWQVIISLLRSSGNVISLSSLQISFGLTSTVSDISAYHFPRTFSYFTRLTKLVVHGVANDNLMMSLGTYCHFLRYLDIRHTEVTERGVIAMLVNRPMEVKRFAAEAKFTLPASFLTPLTHTLEYFDMSNMLKEGLLLEQDRVIRYACPHLRGTPNRLFFQPDGTTRFRCQLRPGHSLNEIRNKAMSSTRTQLADTIVELGGEFIGCHHGHCSITGFELRVNSVGEEVAVLFFHKELLVVEVGIRELTVVSITSHTISTMDFLRIDILAKVTPHLRYIKASLRGTLTSEHCLEHLKTVTMPAAHGINTIKSIVKFCRKLVYIEAREVLLSKGMMDDDDLVEMIGEGHEHLETFRLLFPTDISLAPGVKNMTILCPNFKLVGDLFRWNIPFPALSRFSLNLNVHNLDMAFEYNMIIYNSNTPCKEFYT